MLITSFRLKYLLYRVVLSGFQLFDTGRLHPVRERAILIYKLDGKALPTSAGGPIRFFIPDFAACHTSEIDECANVKFVDRIEFSAAPGRDNRPHDEKEHAELHEREQKQ